MEFEFNSQYVAKDKFGFEISSKYPFIIVHIEIYDENRRKEIIDIFKILTEYLLEKNNEKGIKRVFLVDAKDVKKQLVLSENNINNRKNFVVETFDLLTGEFVPLFSKIIEKDDKINSKIS